MPSTRAVFGKPAWLNANLFRSISLFFMTVHEYVFLLRDPFHFSWCEIQQIRSVHLDRTNNEPKVKLESLYLHT